MSYYEFLSILGAVRLTGYLQDVSDDVDGALEDASHLVERLAAAAYGRGHDTPAARW